MRCQQREAERELGDLGEASFYSLVAVQLCSMARCYDNYGELHAFVAGLGVRTGCDRGIIISTLALMARIARCSRKGLNADNVKRYWLAAFQLTHDLLSDKTFKLSSWEKLTGGEYGEKHIAFLQFSLLKVLQWDYGISTEEYLRMADGLVFLFKHNSSVFSGPFVEPACSEPQICDTPGATPPSDYQASVNARVW